MTADCPGEVTIHKKAQSKARKVVHVVAAVIFNPDCSRVLLARRPDHLHQGGLWEFPGGKVESGESVEQALQRELQEEVNICPEAFKPYLGIQHSYPDKTVRLDVWQVTAFSGQPNGNEGQEIDWVGLEDLPGYAFPAANQAILDKLGRKGIG